LNSHIRMQHSKTSVSVYDATYPWYAVQPVG
jgi:hypothetical protein